MTTHANPEQAAEHVQRLVLLHREATARAARPPLIDESAWRGPAHEAYRRRALDVAAELDRAVDGLAHAVALAREEYARALG